jgi:phage shock protein PspC (stress-responsive transcriptional regulator)
MDKTIKINIAGTLFQIDDVGYRILREYLQSINNRLKNVQGGLETIEDIESRIAEIFQSQKGLAGVITQENVDAMISIIGKPEDFDHNEPEEIPPVYIASRKRMYRNPDDSIISGVCGGIGAYLNTDPVLFRILFVLFTVFFGVGFFVYIALWIALPPANNDTRKRELYGNAYNSYKSQNRQKFGTYSTDSSENNSDYYSTSKIGNAINEVFRAIGRVCYIVLRVFLIIIGVVFVLTGFLVILSFVMIFVFKYPGAISTEAFNFNLTSFPDFLNYIVNPSTAPWIITLTILAIILPILALIYMGVKMVFWFRAKDGIFSLIGFVLWVMIIAALAVILFSEGISFAETSKSSSSRIFTHSPDTLYIQTDKKVSQLIFDKELSLTEDGYYVYINDTKKELYIRPYIKVLPTDGDASRIELRKQSCGRTKTEATKKTEDLLFNFSLNGDTLILDEYFTIPSGHNWSADIVDINIYLPEGTVIKTDNPAGSLFHTHSNGESEEDSNLNRSGNLKKSWVLTDDGLKVIDSLPADKK